MFITTHVQAQLRTEEGARPPEAGFTCGHELWCRCWELNLDALQEQEALLAAGPSLQPSDSFTLSKHCRLLSDGDKIFLEIIQKDQWIITKMTRKKTDVRGFASATSKSCCNQDRMVPGGEVTHSIKCSQQNRELCINEAAWLWDPMLESGTLWMEQHRTHRQLTSQYEFMHIYKAPSPIIWWQNHILFWCTQRLPSGSFIM